MDILLGYPQFCYMWPLSLFLSILSTRETAASVWGINTPTCAKPFLNEFIFTRTVGTQPTDPFRSSEERSYLIRSIHSETITVIVTIMAARFTYIENFYSPNLLRRSHTNNAFTDQTTVRTDHRGSRTEILHACFESFLSTRNPLYIMDMTVRPQSNTLSPSPNHSHASHSISTARTITNDHIQTGTCLWKCKCTI